jgi:quinol monooxygenase YgiN
MLIRVVRMNFEEDKVENFLEIFNKSKNKIRSFEGCHHLKLMQDYHRSNIFVTYSHWENDEALDNYRNSELFEKVWADTKALFASSPVAFSMKQVEEV